MKICLKVFLPIILLSVFASATQNFTKEIPNVVPISWLKDNFNNERLVILDVREYDAYKKGHIKGAKSVPLADMASNLDKYTSYKNKAVLIYCDSGNSATRAIKLLKAAGFAKVNNLDGGIAAWKEANMPLSKK